MKNATWVVPLKQRNRQEVGPKFRDVSFRLVNKFRAGNRDIAAIRDQSTRQIYKSRLQNKIKFFFKLFIKIEVEIGFFYSNLEGEREHLVLHQYRLQP